MKKFIYLLLLLCVFLVGMEIGVPSKASQSKEIQEKIDDFEDEIANPNNKYKPGEDNPTIVPNITNSIAKTGEKAIAGLFDFSFNFLDSLIRNR